MNKPTTVMELLQHKDILGEAIIPVAIVKYQERNLFYDASREQWIVYSNNMHKVFYSGKSESDAIAVLIRNSNDTTKGED